MTSAMGQAYDKARELLHDGGQPAIVNEIIARRIIEIAEKGEHEADKLSRAGAERVRDGPVKVGSGLLYLAAAGFVSPVSLGSTVFGENCPGLEDPTIPRIGAAEVSVVVALYPGYSVGTAVGTLRV